MPAGSAASSRMVTSSRADALAGLEERAPLLHREGREAEVAEHVEQVDDGVLLEDHGVVAGRHAPPRPRDWRPPCSAASRPIAAASMPVWSTAALSA